MPDLESRTDDRRVGLQLAVRTPRPALGWALMGIAFVLWFSFPLVLGVFGLRGDAGVRLFLFHMAGGIVVFLVGMCVSIGLRIDTSVPSRPDAGERIRAPTAEVPPSAVPEAATDRERTPAPPPPEAPAELPAPAREEAPPEEIEWRIETGIVNAGVLIGGLMFFCAIVALLSLLIFGLDGLSAGYLLGTGLVTGSFVLAIRLASRSSAAVAASVVVLGLPAVGVLLGLALRRPDVVAVTSFTVAVGAALLAVVWWMGYEARRSPELLLKWFETGVR